MIAFWDIAPCWLGQGLLQRGYTALFPSRLPSSYSPPWKPEISHIVRLQVDATVSKKVTVFWHVEPHSLVEIYHTKLHGATSQKTAIFNNYILSSIKHWQCINQLIFVMEMVSVYFEVGTEFLRKLLFTWSSCSIGLMLSSELTEGENWVIKHWFTGFRRMIWAIRICNMQPVSRLRIHGAPIPHTSCLAWCLSY
jgi:hypothetical protein